MSSNGRAETLDVLSLTKALLLLNELKLDEVEAVISDHLRAMLTAAQHTHEEISLAYATLLRLTLNALATCVAKNDPILEKQLRMVTLRMTPPLLSTELKSLQSYMLNLFNQIDPTQTTSFPKAATEGYGLQTGRGNTEQKLTTTTRDQLDPKNQEFSQISRTLSRHVNEAIAQNQEFGVLLGVELDELREAERIQDVEKRRLVLIDEINKFVKKHRMLSEKFDSAHRYLNLVESSNQHLSDELDRARLSSLTDELTGLPNRRAFLRRLEDEIGRVKRYGIPVSVAIVGLDGFKAVHDSWGQGGGDAVLQAYAKRILSVFRHHDIVSRYGAEEFSIIFSNTKREGALRALQKIQEQISNEVCRHHGESFSMPTFSAGLAEYSDGETPADFVKRIEAALFSAKRMGRHRIEIAHKPLGSSESQHGDSFDAA